jgi:integrase
MIIKPQLKNVNAKTKVGKIYIRVELNDTANSVRQQVFYKTEFEALKSKFKNGKMLGNTSKAKKINEYLFDEISKIKDSINELEKKKININKDSLVSLRIESKEIEKTIVGYLNELKHKYENANKDPIAIKIQTLTNHFIIFSGKNKYYSYSINQKLIDDFSNYLLIDNNLHPNTVHRHMKVIKILLNHLKNHYHIDIPNLSFPRQVPTEKAFLTKEEIKKIFDYEPKTYKEEKVKKLIIIGIYTGLRYSDMKRLNKSHIHGNLIKMKMQKVNTDDYLVIPLSEQLREVLESINYDVNSILMSNQKYNDYISELCKNAGITYEVEKTVYTKGKRHFELVQKYKLISAHNLRNTFISMAIMAKMDINMIMKITGHKKLSTLQVYIKQTEDYVTQDYQLFSNFINN